MENLSQRFPAMKLQDNNEAGVAPTTSGKTVAPEQEGSQPFRPQVDAPAGKVPEAPHLNEEGTEGGSEQQTPEVNLTVNRSVSSESHSLSCRKSSSCQTTLQR